MSETFKIVKLLDPLNPTIVTGGLVPRGAYNAGTDYAVGDSVSYQGSSYVQYLDAAAGTLPTNTTYWQVLANKGDDGSGGGGSSDWGDIGGTLSDQTDLQDALDDKQNDLGLTGIGDGLEIDSTLLKVKSQPEDFTIDGSGALTLSSTSASPGDYTNANISVDEKGRITAASDGTLVAPGGTDTQVQFNSGGDFAGDTGLTYDSSAPSLKVGGGTGAGVTFEVNGTADLLYLSMQGTQALDNSRNAHLADVDASGYVTAVGNVTGANLSGTNTGDQTTVSGNAGTATALATGRTIGTLTGDVTTAGSSFNGTANNTNATVLATVNSNVGSFTKASVTVNAKGLVTAASSGTADFITSLTTTGTSGAASVSSGVLNIPQYSGGGGGSGITRTVTVTSGSYAVGSTASTDYVYLTAGAHTATLPTASGNSNRYTFKNNHSANVTVARAGSDTIDGATSISIAPQSSVDLISNGSSAWNVI